MKIFWLSSISVLLVVVTACQPAAHSADKSMLRPGDEIDGMVITTGVAQTPPLWAYCSPALENDGVVSTDCQIPQLPRLAIGHTFGLTDPALQTLDWSALTWALHVDGQPVDLMAFGIQNYIMPDLAPHPSSIREIFSQMRAWDVVLTNPTPGMHTLQGIAYTEADTYNWIVNFTVEPSLEP